MCFAIMGCFGPDHTWIPQNLQLQWVSPYPTHVLFMLYSFYLNSTTPSCTSGVPRVPIFRNYFHRWSETIWNHSIFISCLCNCCIKAIIALTVVLSYTIRPRVHIRIAAVRISGTLVLMPYCLNRIVNMLKEYHTCAQTSILSEFWINTLSEQWKHVDVVRGNHTYASI